jgi:hypothetical protein
MTDSFCVPPPVASGGENADEHRRHYKLERPFCLYYTLCGTSQRRHLHSQVPLEARDGWPPGPPAVQVDP